MKLARYLYHDDTKTFVCLGRALPNKSGFESGKLALAFLASRPYGTFQMWHNRGYRPHNEEEGWVELSKRDLRPGPTSPSASKR